jgi:hypothetical protein
MEAAEKPLCRAFSMSGTGLEPVTAACRAGAAVRIGSLAFAQATWLSGIGLATERLSARERTLFLAILATGQR